MDNFAFIIHPVTPKRDVQRKFPILGKILSERAIDYLCQFFPPLEISHITGIKSQATDKEIEGWFIACPLTPKQLISLPKEVVYKKIIQAGKKAEKLGAKIVGLGGFTAVVGDAGQTISQHLNIPVTTGDSYTVAVAVEAAKKAALQMDIEPKSSIAAVVGATGSIGRVCAQMLAPSVGEILLIGLRPEPLEALKYSIEKKCTTPVSVSTDISHLQRCDLVLTVTNSIQAIIQAHHLKSGSIICDVARPRDVSQTVMQERDDVLVIEGGTVRVPGAVKFNFNFGLSPNLAFACMAETMTLALEGRYENYTLGKNIQIGQVKTMFEMATRHGFHIGGFRSQELSLTGEYINQIAKNARHKQTQLHWANPYHQI